MVAGVESMGKEFRNVSLPGLRSWVHLRVIVSQSSAIMFVEGKSYSVLKYFHSNSVGILVTSSLGQYTNIKIYDGIQPETCLTPVNKMQKTNTFAYFSNPTTWKDADLIEALHKRGYNGRVMLWGMFNGPKLECRVSWAPWAHRAGA